MTIEIRPQLPAPDDKKYPPFFDENGTRLYYIDQVCEMLGPPGKPIVRVTLYDWMHRLGLETQKWEGFKVATIDQDTLDHLVEAKSKPGRTPRRPSKPRKKRTVKPKLPTPVPVAS